MHNQPQSNRYTEILDELQLQSWQLELVISGFAIFGLFSVLEPLQNTLQDYSNQEQIFLVIFFFFLRMAALAMLCNLIVHVFLRSIWIGAIGLRSVSGDIEYNKLNFSPFFTRKLQAKLGSFDSYIDKLERYSSVLFALTILMFFYILGAFISLFTPLIVLMIFANFGFSNWRGWLKLFIYIPIAIYYFGLLIIFFDFLTQGYFKKPKRISKLYYPIYIFYGWVTLAIFYRHLLYNFQDNRFGKNLVKMLVPFYILLLLASTIKEKASFIDVLTANNSSSNVGLKINYMDALEKNDRSGRALLDSETITSPYLKLHIPWGGYLESYLSEYDSLSFPRTAMDRGLSSTILKTRMWFNHDYEINAKNKVDAYLEGFKDIIVVSIDGKTKESELLFYQDKNKNFFLRTAYSISHLKNGKHVLKIKMIQSKTDSTKFELFETIPFWYFPDN